jgi:thiol-disulfide isomerase/thioredoxin
MRSLRLLGCLVALAVSTVSAQSLKIGDAAPALRQGAYVQGEPVVAFEQGKVYVVEFWATWCGPCVDSIPHVNKLQLKHADSVVVIGQNVWEQDESKVKPFIEKMGEKMTYRVALDADGAMAETWMKAAGQDGIPAAFIIDQQGQLAWVGHPMQMDEPLAQVLAGTFDTQAARAKAEANAAFQKVMMAKLQPLMMKQDTAGVIAACEELLAEYPDRQLDILNLKIAAQFRGKDFAGMNQTMAKVVELSNDDPMMLNGLAWFVATTTEIEPRDLALAEKAANRAVELTGGTDAAILDTLARVYAEQGNHARAVATIEKALAHADADLKANLQKALDEYKARLN